KLAEFGKLGNCGAARQHGDLSRGYFGESTERMDLISICGRSPNAEIKTRAPERRVQEISSSLQESEGEQTYAPGGTVCSVEGKSSSAGAWFLVKTTIFPWLATNR